MTPKEYKNQIESRDVLDRGTLNVTLGELEGIGELRLANEIRRILANNKIEDPSPGSKERGVTSEFYKIDLTVDDVDLILEMFRDREVSSVQSDTKFSIAASFYAKMSDNWSRLTD